MRTIESKRLLLRPWELSDADFLLDLESRWETIRFLGPHAKQMETREEAVASIERRRALDDSICGIWAIARKDLGPLVGNLLLKRAPLSKGVSGEPPTEIGWHLHPDAQGHGYATEAARALLEDAATNGLRTVIAVTNPENVPSQKVCERLGLNFAGWTEDFYDERNLLFRMDLEPKSVLIERFEFPLDES